MMPFFFFNSSINIKTITDWAEYSFLHPPLYFCRPPFVEKQQNLSSGKSLEWGKGVGETSCKGFPFPNKDDLKRIYKYVTIIFRSRRKYFAQTQHKKKKKKKSHLCDGESKGVGYIWTIGLESSSALYLHYSKGLDWLPPQGEGVVVSQKKRVSNIYILTHYPHFSWVVRSTCAPKQEGDGRIEIT